MILSEYIKRLSKFLEDNPDKAGFSVIYRVGDDDGGRDFVPYNFLPSSGKVKLDSYLPYTPNEKADKSDIANEADVVCIN